MPAAASSSRPESDIQLKTKVPHKLEMKKNITYFNGVGIVVGIIIGTGIFISPSKVIEGTGSVALSLLVWALGGIFALLGALTYVELAILIPDFGCDYIYLLEGFAPRVNGRRDKVRALPAFVYSFISIVLRRPASMALRCLVTSEHFLRLFYTHCESWFSLSPPQVSVELFAASLAMLVGLVNSYSTKFTGKLQCVFTVCKLFALTVIVAGGIKGFFGGRTHELVKGFEGTTTNYGDIAGALYSSLYAFTGWQALNYALKEMPNPARDLRRTLVTSLIIVIVFYFLVNISYLTIITKEELIATEVVAVGFGRRLAGYWAEVFMIIAVGTSSLGGGLGDCLTFTRVFYVASREGHSIESHSYIQKDLKTPIPLMISYISLTITLLILPFNIGSFLKIIGFIDWLFIGLSMVVLVKIKLEMKQRHPAPQFAVPIWMPLLMIVISCFLVLTPILASPSFEYFYSLVVIGAAIVFYVPFIVFECSLPGMESLNRLIQKLFLVLPAEKEY